MGGTSTSKNRLERSYISSYPVHCAKPCIANTYSFKKRHEPHTFQLCNLDTPLRKFSSRALPFTAQRFSVVSQLNLLAAQPAHASNISLSGFKETDCYSRDMDAFDWERLRVHAPLPTSTVLLLESKESTLPTLLLAGRTRHSSNLYQLGSCSWLEEGRVFQTSNMTNCTEAHALRSDKPQFTSRRAATVCLRSKTRLCRVVLMGGATDRLGKTQSISS